MRYTYPDYYEEFQCLAADCPDTCCAGWQILIDGTSLTHYREHQGPYQVTLRGGIDEEEACFRQTDDSRCAFLREDGLCDLYANLGEDSLCKTCAEYPRHTEEFENEREITLSLSCPEVARILLNRTEPPHFFSREDEEVEVFEEFDAELFTYLKAVRKQLLDLATDRTEQFSNRLMLVLTQGAKAAQTPVTIKKKDEYERLMDCFACMYQLELLNPDWDRVLLESEILLFQKGKEAFMKARTRFEKAIDVTSVLEQILVYFLFTYLPGAVYDENLIGKVEASVGHVVELYLLFLARFIKNEEYLDMEDMIELTYRYCREVEHSDENLETVEQIVWFEREDA